MVAVHSGGWVGGGSDSANASYNNGTGDGNSGGDGCGSNDGGGRMVIVIIMVVVAVYGGRWVDDSSDSGNGIRENENVDKLAKAALNKASCSGKLICWSDLNPKVNAYIHTVWQENWDAEGANELHEVLPTWEKTSAKEVKEEVENGRR
ncbi:ribonuclease hi [Plakobranchus ocellatus]|uniref:Ribonuclease hi n=1 Tax=Plakobranchus ocellatus TaxID=259542 RepID=A0AAV4BR23_9GAST|nr:ribonuclease hi [Plakobranchus ocellatus]